jgi:phage terminase large subunit-like protein
MMKNNTTNYIFEYYQKIKNGSVTVGKWIDMVMEFLIKGLQDRKFFYDGRKADRAVKFIETFCHHCEGRADLLKLELWQKAIIAAIFGIVDAQGIRQFREVVVVVARKNGKSLLASAIANYCLFCDGEYGAKVFCVAPKLEQSDIIYNDIWQTVQSEPELERLIKRRKSDYYVESTNSSVKKIAFNHKKSDGFNPSLTICDEIASWQGDAGLKQYEVMKSALGSRTQPLILSIST